jgi:hypothetical protein
MLRNLIVPHWHGGSVSLRGPVEPVPLEYQCLDSNLVSKNVQIGCAIALIHEALGVLGSRRRGIRISRLSYYRRLDFSVLVPFVEGGDVNHLQLTGVRIRQG